MTKAAKSYTIRELVSSCIQSGNMRHDVDQRDTVEDVIGALARTDPLGAALWRVTGNMDRASFIRARELLTKRLQEQWFGTPLRLIESVAQVAMEEWMLGHNYRDVTRVCRICAPAHVVLNGVFERAHEELRAADARVTRQISYQLERTTPAKPLKPKV